MTGGQGRGGGQERGGVTVSHRQSGWHHCGALQRLQGLHGEIRIETVHVVVQRRQQVLLLGRAWHQRGNQGEIVKTGF